MAEAWELSPAERLCVVHTVVRSFTVLGRALRDYYLPHIEDHTKAAAQGVCHPGAPYTFEPPPEPNSDRWGGGGGG